MSCDNAKLVSVIMGIYNCETTLAEALDCIVAQTYTNWEIIVCDDGSSDDTLAVANEFKNKYPNKIFVLKNERNMGLNYTLNRCLYESHGEYIARMDGDDTCSLDRFEKEVRVLEENEDIAIVSSDMSFFDEEGFFGQTDADPAPTNKSFLNSTPFCHASCMVRREAYLAVDGYSVDKKLLRVEDYHLWVKMYAKGYKGVNIKECLYQMRDDRNATKRRKFKYRLNAVYVRAFAIKQLKLPFYCYVYCLKPIVVGLTPIFIYNILHRKRLKSNEN